MNWQDEPATDAQKNALFNKALGFGIKHIEPKTKGEASLEFKRLDSIIYNIISMPQVDDEPNADDDDWLDPIY